MTRITKTFSTLDQAEEHQEELYLQYNSVQLVRSPRFSQEGIYEWDCADPI
jgi:hypothetical protein